MEKMKRAAVTISPTGKRGFTIIELLVVMGVIGLLLAMSIPAATRYAGRMRLGAATREVMGLLSLARSSAISSRLPQTVLVDVEAGRLSIEDSPDAAVQTKAVTLASSVTIRLTTSDGRSLEPPVRLTFQPNGSLAGRSVEITLSDPSRAQTISIAAPTGAIIVRHAETPNTKFQSPDKPQ